MLQLLQRLPQLAQKEKGKDRITTKDVERARNLLQQFKKSEVSTDNNFRDFNVMDQATGEVKKLEVKPYEQTVAQKMVGGGISRPEQPIKGVKPIQVKGRKFQGIF
jgi:hypothetical protein